MKGGFFFAILLTASICDVNVTHVLKNEGEREFHDVNTKNDKISDSEKELNDSEVNYELNSIEMDKEITRDDYDLVDDTSIENETEINEKFDSKENATVINKELGGYVKDDYVYEENNYDYDKTTPVKDFNYSYDEDSNEFIEARTNDHAISNEEGVKTPTWFSRDEDEMLSDEEDSNWASEEEIDRVSEEQTDQVGKLEKGEVSTEKRDRVSRKKHSRSSKLEKGQLNQEKRGEVNQERKGLVNEGKRRRVSKQEKVIVHERERNRFINEKGEEGWIGNELHASDHEKIRNPLNSTTFSTINHYFCITEDVTEKRLIFYGTKAWEFPLQDVNLTLTYPTAKPESPPDPDSEEVDYIITGFNLILYIDGAQTKGYIIDGGLLQDKFGMTFINTGITSLMYRFWLYGTPRQNADGLELHSYRCS